MVSSLYNNIILLACLAGTCTWVGCSLVENPSPKKPVIQLIAGDGYIHTDTVLKANTPYQLNIACTRGTAELDSLIVLVNNQVIWDSAAFNRFQFNIEIGDTIPDKTEVVHYEFILYDKAGSGDTLDLHITVGPDIRLADCDGCLTAGSGEILTGSVHKISLDGFRSGAKLSKLVLYLNENILQEVPLSAEEKNNGFTGKLIDDIEFSVNPGSYVLEAILDDESGLSDNTLLDLEIVPYFHHILLKLGNVNNEQQGGFLSVLSGQVYDKEKVLQNADLQDFVYFSQGSIAAPDDEQAILAIPEIADLPVQNMTRFGLDMPDDINYDHVTDEQLQSLVIDDNLSRVEDLQAGDLISFRTVQGQQGLIQIISLQAGNDQNGSIDFGVKFIEL